MMNAPLPPLTERDAATLAQGAAETLRTVHWEVRYRQTGRVIRTADGVAHVSGLPSVRYGELVETASGLVGMSFDVRPASVGVLFLDAADAVSAGDEVRSTGRVASVAAGWGLLGRTVDALGRPLDGGPDIEVEEYRPVEREAPGVAERVPVHEPLRTGIKTIDALLPIGRGQRELIVGDRSTGKTALALDAVLAQADGDVLCVYAALGQRKSAVAEVVAMLREHEALGRTVVVCADADSPPGQQYLAPYAACSIAEHFMEAGRHVLVVYDNLTAHADTYRSIGLLFGRPPGREAYPADVFYLHARLLERATRLRDDLGGGSLTALPIADTRGGSIAGYIPTNLISITDGQIILDNRLFNEGFRPAIDVGLSVSRVGGKAQPPILRTLAGDLKLLYAQIDELESFARFGAELEPEARARLDRGRRLREALKQNRLLPLRLVDEIATLFAVREGLLDPLPLDRVGAALSTLYPLLDTMNEASVKELATLPELGAGHVVELRGRIETACEIAALGGRS